MHQSRLPLPDRQFRPIRLAQAAFLVTFAVLLVPVLAVEIPPLTDYPNHLSRLWLVGGGVDLPVVAAMYAVSWDTLTNIGIDLLAKALTPLFGYMLVGRIAVAAAVLMAPVGGVLLWRVLHGRFHWWQLALALLAWNTGLLLGFLNFEIGIGFALMAAAVDPALVRRGAIATAAVRIGIGCLLVLVHLFALVFFAVLLCGIAIGPAFRALLDDGAPMRIARSVVTIAATSSWLRSCSRCLRPLRCDA
jgi:hypothetical protein